MKLRATRSWSQHALAFLTLAAFSAGPPAEAATVSFSFTVSLDYGGQLVNQSNPVTDAFNLNPYLSIGKYSVKSADIAFQLADNNDPLSVTSTDFGPYALLGTSTESCGEACTAVYDFYSRDSTVHQLNPAESALVSVASTNYNPATSAIDSTSHVGGISEMTLTSVVPTCFFELGGVCLQWGETYYYRVDQTEKYEHTTGFSGDMNIAAILGPPALADLIQDGVLPFTVTAADGDFLINTAQLTVVAEPVPIPASVWLLATGLLGLVGVARTRRSRG